MKNLILPLLIVNILATSFCLYRSFSTPSKIAYVDTGKLLEGSKDMQLTRTKLKGEFALLKANVDTLTAEFQEALKKHEKSIATMSKKEIQLSQELLRNKQNQLIQYQKAVEQKAMQQEQQQTAEVLKKVNTVISEYGKTKGYTLIFATSQGNIAYGDQGVEITKDIIDRVNK